MCYIPYSEENENIFKKQIICKLTNCRMQCNKHYIDNFIIDKDFFYSQVKK